MPAAMQEWEAQNSRNLQEQEARAQREQEQDELLTYTREDAYSVVRSVLGDRQGALF